MELGILTYSPKGRERKPVNCIDYILFLRK